MKKLILMLLTVATTTVSMYSHTVEKKFKNPHFASNIRVTEKKLNDIEEQVKYNDAIIMAISLQNHALEDIEITNDELQLEIECLKKKLEEKLRQKNFLLSYDYSELETLRNVMLNNELNDSNDFNRFYDDNDLKFLKKEKNNLEKERKNKAK